MSTPRRPRAYALSTLAVHAGEDAHVVDSPVVTPLFQSVNFNSEAGSGGTLRYPRYGNAPNAEIVQKRLAALDGAEACLVLSSGMGATACALLALLRPGDHLLTSKSIYGGTQELITREFAALGITSTLVNPHESRAWRRGLRKETRAVFLESPVNPSCRVVDLRPLSYLTQENGLALVVDSTFASPVNFRPLEHGADVVIHSTTKFLNGHHDVIGGAVLGTASYIEEVRRKMILWGQAPDPFACWMLERGLKTLDVRVKRQNENAMGIARWADERKEVSVVHYPGLPSHPDHAAAVHHMDGFGGMLGLELTGGARAADRFTRKLRLIRNAPSLGGVDSLVCEPRYTSHTHLTSEQRAALGIPDGFLRVSVGIEDMSDLIADLEQALH
ncbi:MAG: PLP-dependent aspartate aminotransferase family protein [Gemmatimonadota bacterium]|nr:PLP-dependent aspartate aminotransferase family protein [Gemmatimonadota bacterium]